MGGFNVTTLFNYIILTNDFLIFNIYLTKTFQLNIYIDIIFVRVFNHPFNKNVIQIDLL